MDDQDPERLPRAGADPRGCLHEWRLVRRWFHSYRRQWMETRRCARCFESRQGPVTRFGDDAAAV